MPFGELAEMEQCCQKMCETTLAMLRKALALNGAHHKFINYAIAWIDPGVVDSGVTVNRKCGKEARKSRRRLDEKRTISLQKHQV